MNILFYTPVNFRCRDLESLAKKYMECGHQVFFLSQCERGPMHDVMDNLGIKTFASKEPKGAIFSQFIRLVRFSRQNKIDLLFSHLEPTNFVSVIAQFFIKSKVIIFRHHVNEARLYGFDKSFAYRLTYTLARRIISVSEEGKRYMIDNEKIPERKVLHINLGYDFSLYENPNFKEVNRIRLAYKSELLLISIGRLTEYKRHNLSIELVRQANLNELNASLIILGVGEQENELRNLVAEYSLQKNVFFLGYVQNILDYLAAADFLIHPSILESSCVTVKEAGLVNLPVIICDGVGDFNKYLKHEVNSIVLDPNNFVELALAQVKLFVKNPEYYKAMGVVLKSEILSRFSIERTFHEYSGFTKN